MNAWVQKKNKKIGFLFYFYLPPYRLCKNGPGKIRETTNQLRVALNLSKNSTLYPLPLRASWLNTTRPKHSALLKKRLQFLAKSLFEVASLKLTFAKSWNSLKGNL